MTKRQANDRRVRRTKLAIFEAFRTLVLSRRYEEIRVAEIIDAANIGRSTFYDHFKSKDDVLLCSIEPLFDVLADSVTEDAIPEHVSFVLSHFWDQRALARVIFGSDLFFKLSRKLAHMMELRLAHANGDSVEIVPPLRARAIERATAQLGLIRSWLLAEFACEVEALTDYLLACSQAASRPSYSNSIGPAINT